MLGFARVWNRLCVAGFKIVIVVDVPVHKISEQSESGRILYYELAAPGFPFRILSRSFGEKAWKDLTRDTVAP